MIRFASAMLNLAAASGELKLFIESGSLMHAALSVFCMVIGVVAFWQWLTDQRLA